MSRNVFTKTLWDNRRSVLGWTLGISIVAAMYAAFYPTVRNPDMVAAIEAYPPALREAMNLDDLASPEGYLASSVFGILVPILVLLFGAFFGARAIAADEDAGTLDLTLAHPVSRVQVVLHRLTALAVAMTVIGVAVLLALLAVSGPAELTISADRFAAMILHMMLLGIFFGALAMTIGALGGRRSVALGVTTVVGVGGYLANTLAPQAESIAWLQKWSPFYYYLGGEPLVNGAQLADMAVLAGAAGAFILVGAVVFNRRDIAA